jgi:hypothetical protein
VLTEALDTINASEQHNKDDDHDYGDNDKCDEDRDWDGRDPRRYPQSAVDEGSPAQGRNRMTNPIWIVLRSSPRAIILLQDEGVGCDPSSRLAHSGRKFEKIGARSSDLRST